MVFGWDLTWPGQEGGRERERELEREREREGERQRERERERGRKIKIGREGDKGTNEGLQCERSFGRQAE